MNRKKYSDLMCFFESHKKIADFIIFINKIITAIVFISYPVFLMFVLHTEKDRMLSYVLVPAVSFALVSFFRYAFNAKRPYEVFEFDPLKDNPKMGQSFPSRHVFSSFIIAFVFLDFNIYLGFVFLFLSLLIAVLRVIMGIHFIKDVLSGFLIAFLIYIVMFLIILK